jgi:FkbM family methyltransferase
MNEIGYEIGCVTGKHGRFVYPPQDRYVGRSLAVYGEYSDQEVAFLQTLVRPGAVVVEVGANIGAITVPLARAVGPTGRVLAFEPQTAVCQLLTRNLADNDLPWAQAVPAALGQAVGLASIPVPTYTQPGNFGAVSLGKTAGQGEACAPVLSLDSLGLEQLDLLKIDCEGMEVEVLLGARATIARCRPAVYVENDRTERSAELITLLGELGYTLWWHLPPLYNRRNAAGVARNVFPGIVSINMVGLPQGRQPHFALRQVDGPAARWQDAAQALVHEHRAPREGQPTCAVVRLGAYGDALWASSVFPHLKAEGYHLTVYTEARGADVLRADPHVDRIIVQDHVPGVDLDDYWREESKHYDRFLNLTESVERNMLASEVDIRFFWPEPVRREIFAGNYLQRVHKLCQVPHAEQADFRQRFYATPEEALWATEKREQIAGPGGTLVVIAAAGSSPTKYWPHIAALCAELDARGAHVVVLGDPRGLEIRRARVHVIGQQWSLRQALALAQRADAVIGQETGILNAVAMEPMRKVVLLSHSTPENLTKHWVNTVAISGKAPCWPCHRMHKDFTYCTQDADTGKALCQTLISVEQVLYALGAAHDSGSDSAVIPLKQITRSTFSGEHHG